MPLWSGSAPNERSKANDLGNIGRAPVAPGAALIAGQRSDQGRKPCGVFLVWIRAEFQQRSDERPPGCDRSRIPDRFQWSAASDHWGLNPGLRPLHAGLRGRPVESGIDLSEALRPRGIDLFQNATSQQIDHGDMNTAKTCYEIEE
jgi:hypothetical protein